MFTFLIRKSLLNIGNVTFNIKYSYETLQYLNLVNSFLSNKRNNVIYFVLSKTLSNDYRVNCILDKAQRLIRFINLFVV